jgi:hypothetical protein
MNRDAGDTMDTGDTEDTVHKQCGQSVNGVNNVNASTVNGCERSENCPRKEVGRTVVMGMKLEDVIDLKELEARSREEEKRDRPFVTKLNRAESKTIYIF